MTGAHQRKSVRNTWVTAIAVTGAAALLGLFMVPWAMRVAGPRPIAAHVTGLRRQAPTAPTGHPARVIPAAAAGPISRALGRDEPRYRIERAGGGFVTGNATQKLRAWFGASGAVVRSGMVTVGIRLRGYGYAAHLTPVPPARPAAAANRLSYRQGPLTQWYANGPLGLEQGFTLAVPPPGHGPGMPGHTGRGGLTFALEVSGGAHVWPASGGVVFTQRGTSLAYGGLVVTDARGRRLPAWLRPAEGGLALRVDDAGAPYPLRVDPVFTQEATLTAAGRGILSGFGSSVTVGQGAVAVGAPSATVGLNVGQGAVYMFTPGPNGWADATQSAMLTASNGAAGDLFGTSVTMFKGAVWVGAIHADGGVVYVFTEPAGGWSGTVHEIAVLTQSNPVSGDEMDISMAASGQLVVVGATGVNDQAGAVFLFFAPKTGWSGTVHPAATLTSSVGRAGDDLGASVATDGTTVVAGAPGLVGTGGVYVFTEPQSGWTGDITQTAVLTAASRATLDRLGSSVAFTGGVIAAGAPGVNDLAGAVSVFTEPAGGWHDETQTAELTASNSARGALLGTSVATYGSVVIAGAPGANSAAGAAYVFSQS